jgi:Ca2+/Na+ antiporter
MHVPAPRHQIALGTVIGSAVFMITGGLGLTLLLAPMEVRIPKQGGLAMIASLLLFAVLLWNDGTVSRAEGALLVVAAVGLIAWLYITAPVFVSRREDERPELEKRRVHVYPGSEQELCPQGGAAAPR